MTAKFKWFCGLILFCLPASAATQADLFRYDDARPLNLVEKSSEKQGAVTVHDISFNDVADEATQAYLVVPDGKGPFAAVLYAHWLGDPETSNRTQFLQEAKQLSKKGVVALLVDMPWSNQYWFGSRKLDDDYEFSVRQVQNLRRALDVLTQRPDVDGKRVAFVGHDFGASYGAIMLGVDWRVRFAVLMAGTPVLSDWFLLGAKLEGDARQAYIAKMAPLDPINFVGKAKSVPILFQFATQDKYVARDKAELLAGAAGNPKELRWYDTGHGMNDQARADRVEWLESKLGLDKT